MFQLPALVTMSIAATRMYRSLVDYASNFTDLYSDLFILFLLALTAAVVPTAFKTAIREVVHEFR